MKETLLEYIQNELLRGGQGAQLTEMDDLLGSGMVDSIGMMKLIAFVEQECQITVPAADMVIENFSTVGAIVNYLNSRVNS